MHFDMDPEKPPGSKKLGEENLTAWHSGSKRGQLSIVGGRDGSGLKAIRFEQELSDSEPDPEG